MIATLVKKGTLSNMRNEFLASDLPWALYYRDRLSLYEISERLGCSPSDLSPELTSLMGEVLKNYKHSLDHPVQGR